MNIEELRQYKAQKLAEIDYLFKGIYFENVGKNYEIIIENIALDKEIINLDFINTNKICRTLAEETILEIKALYRDLDEIYLDLDMTSSKEEIDKEVDIFIEKVMMELNKLRDNVINDFHRRSKIKINVASFVNSSLESFILKLGSKLYQWKDYQKNPTKKQTEQKSEEENTDETVSDIRLIIMYIYTLPIMRKAKLDMQEDVHNKIKEFERGTTEYNKIMEYQTKIYNGKDFDTISQIYKDAMELQKTKNKSK